MKIILHAEVLRTLLFLRTWPIISVMHTAELHPGGLEFMPGDCYIPIRKGCDWHPLIQRSFAGCGASFAQ